MAAPHVAGVAALVLAVNPGYSATKLKSAAGMPYQSIDQPGCEQQQQVSEFLVR